MSFYTSLTGLKAATTELALTGNNIANVVRAGSKSLVPRLVTRYVTVAEIHIGGWPGVSLKEVRQEFSQGNVEFSSNTQDLAISEKVSSR